MKNSRRHLCYIEGCDNTAIKSHTVQKALLRKIAVNGYVYSIDAFNEYGGYSFKKTGIKTASTQKIFCKQHDMDIFKCIEEEEININNSIQLDTLAYRTLIHLTYKQKDELHNRDIPHFKQRLLLISDKNKISKLKNEFENHWIIPKTNTIKNIEVEAFKLYTAINTGNKSRFIHKCKVIHKNCGISCSTICDPLKDWNGEWIRKIKEEKQNNTYDIPLLINICSYENKTIIVVSYLKTFTMKKKFVDKLFKLKNDNFEKILNQMLFNDAQNVHISPVIYAQKVEPNIEYFERVLCERDILNTLPEVVQVKDFDLEKETINIFNVK